MWLDGYERAPLPGKTGGTYTGDHPWRVVLHSTEGGSVEGAIAAYKAAGVPPTFTIDPKRRRKVQHIDTDHSAYAVMNQPGGVETNRWRAIQFEIVLCAVNAPNLDDSDLAFVAECIGDVIAAGIPIKLHAPTFVAYPDSYGFNAAQRMSFDEWANFDGICGHQHVPENDHGDPGALNIDAVLAHITGAPAPSHQEDDLSAQAEQNIQELWNAVFDANNGMQARLARVEAEVLGVNASSGGLDTQVKMLRRGARKIAAKLGITDNIEA